VLVLIHERRLQHRPRGRISGLSNPFETIANAAFLVNRDLIAEGRPYRLA
jgi:hypothetical protein